MAISIPLLFEKIGRIGHLLYASNTYGSAVPTTLTELFGFYDTGVELQQPYVAAALTQSKQQPYAAETGLNVYQQMAAGTILRTIQLDSPAFAGSLPAALQDVITQMNAASATVKRSTCTAGATATSGNNGNGAVALTVIRGDGIGQELCIAETANLVCTADSFTGGAVPGQESFAFVGAAGNPADVLGWDWPQGSAANAGFTSINGNLGPSATRNLLTNGGFSTWTVANVPDGWVEEMGTAGTQFKQSTTTVYAGGSSLQIVGDSSTLSRITQTFGAVIPRTLTAYAINLWVLVDVVPAAGVLTIDMTDGLGNVLNDNNSVANTKAQSLTGLTAATWTNVQAIFRVPKAIPTTGIKVRLRLSTALSTGTNLFVDNMAFGFMFPPYSGAPGVAVFGGATPFALNDSYAVAVTNDRGGASFCATFQSLWQRLFNLTSYGYQLPSSASPSISDTLITNT